MRYVRAKYKEYEEALAYRIYITDSLFQQGQGRALVKRYVDILYPKPADNRTADEIAADVINRAGLKLYEED